MSLIITVFNKIEGKVKEFFPQNLGLKTNCERNPTLVRNSVYIVATTQMIA